MVRAVTLFQSPVFDHLQYTKYGDASQILEVHGKQPGNEAKLAVLVIELYMSS